jgi:type I restriction enzyme S subunit
MPCNLRCVPFSEVADVNPPTGRSGLSADSLVSFIPMADVSNEGEWTNRQERRLQEVEKGYTTFQENDVLFAKITPCTENGKGAHAIDLTNGIGFGSTEFHVLRPKHADSGRFLFYWSQSEQLRVKAASVMTGSAGQQRVPAQFFAEFEVPLLSLPEQRRIAEILDAADEAIRQTERVIAKLKVVKAGLLHDLLTRGLDEHGRLRDPQAHPEQFKDSSLGKIPRKWGVAKLGGCIEFITDYRGKTPPYVDKGIPAISAENIGDGRIKSITKYVTSEVYKQWLTRGYPLPDDVIFTTEAPVGEVALVPSDQTYLLTRRLIALRPDVGRLRRRFLYWHLFRLKQNGFWEAFTHGSTVPRILKPDILDHIIPLPDSSEQDAIAAVLDAHDARIRAEEVELAKLRQVKRGLMDDLLTGRVRVEG